MNRLAGRPRNRVYVDEVPRLDLRKWQRLKLLQAGSVFTCSWSGGKAVVLVDRSMITLMDGDRTEYVPLVRTAGGVAPCTWFLCPSCGRRCAVLHLRGCFRCRRCAGFSYQSQSEAPADRALRRARRIRQSLGADGNLLKPSPPRPKGMRRSTYIRLLERLDAAEAQVWPRVIRRISVSTADAFCAGADGALG